MKKLIAISSVAAMAAVVILAGIIWYAVRPVPPAEQPEDDVVAVNTGPKENTPEPEESTPEAQEEEPEPDTPDDPGDEMGSLDETYGTGDMTLEELQQLQEEADRALEEAIGGGNQQPDGNQQQQQPSGNQQLPQDGSGQHMTPEELQKKLEEAGINIGKIEEGGGSHTENRPEINW